MKQKKQDSPENSPISLLWKGAIFGLANVIPGVSGGTMAVITGVYDELMDAIGHFIKHWKFLLFYIIGAGIGLIGASFTLESLFEHWPEPTLFCFIGLILGGLPVLWKRADFQKQWKPGWIIGFIISFSLVIVMGWLLDPSESVAITELTAQSAPLIFLAGVAAAAAMIVPGVSGSFLLLLMGMYTTFVGAVTSMNLPILITAAAGIGLGILVVARIIGFFTKRFHHGTYAVIFGLVCASALVLWPGMPSGWMIPLSVLTLGLGILGGLKLGDQ